MNRRIAGHKAQQAGKVFEGYFESACQFNRVICVRIKDGCEKYMWNGKLRLKAAKQPFDFFITKDGWSACIDCKTVDTKTFGYSSIDQDQLSWLCKTGESLESGYVIWFRPLDAVIYFDHRKLSSIMKGQGLKPEHGFNLGSVNEFNPQRILTDWRRNV